MMSVIGDIRDLTQLKSGFDGCRPEVAFYKVPYRGSVNPSPLGEGC